MDAKLTDDFSESILTFMLALSGRGDYQNTTINCYVREYLDAGCRFELIEPVLKRLPAAALHQARLRLDRARADGVKVLSPVCPGYPPQLLHIADPPLALFVRGHIDARFTVAIVGARRCSEYGKQMAFQLGEVVAQAGGCVVSGLAYGVDGAAHRGALRGAAGSVNNPTIAVLGSGVLDIYPVDHKRLADEILESGGGIISEYGTHCLPRNYYFPRRNRIISGLSQKVVIVEAATRSGSLITARLALEQGRDLATVPGAIDSPLSEGTNQLLREGAQLIASTSDVLQDLPAGLLPAGQSSGRAATARVSNRKLAQQHGPGATRLLDYLQRNRCATFDELVDYTAVPTQELRALLVQLELQGIVHASGHSFRVGAPANGRKH